MASTLPSSGPPILSLLLALTLGGTTGCRAQGVPPAPPAPLHLPVAAPPAVSAAHPELWVALASQLKGPDQLTLRSASGRLRLSDASGFRGDGSEFRILWQRQALASPLRLERLVLGPFASFESAEAAADAWKAAGAQPVVARPHDWEVWAVPGSPAPPGDPARRVERIETHAWVPSLIQGSQRLILTGPILIEAPGGLRWDGGVYQGPFRLQADAHGGWTLVEQVPLERYLLGVVPHEIGAGAPAAALAAQAVLARTWAVRNQHRFAVDGYHLCADTQCQVYGDPRLAGGSVSRAVATTAGQLLAWQGRPIHAVYHASSGGVTAAFEEGWAGVPLPYLQATIDGVIPRQALLTLPLDEQEVMQLLRWENGAYGADHPRFRWERQLDAATLTAAARRLDPRFGRASRVTVLERGPSGRVLALQISGTPEAGGVVLRRDAIRRQLRQLPSTLFVVYPDGPGQWRFEGGGFGHGAGLSQAGAIDLAGRGWGLKRILAFYYPGTQLLPLSALSGGGP